MAEAHDEDASAPAPASGASGNPDTSGESGARAADAVVRRRRRWLPTLIWLVPVVVAAGGIMLGVRFLAERGPTITITFRTAEGLGAGSRMSGSRRTAPA